MNLTPTPNSPAPVDTTVDLIQIRICRACRDGIGSECHTPGCALFLHKVDLPIDPNLYEVVTEKSDSQPVDIARLRELLAEEKQLTGSVFVGTKAARIYIALRNDAPALLDEVERLREQVVQQNTRNANAIKEGLRYLDERDKLREEVERLKATNECAVKSAIEQAEQVIRLKEVRESLRQQNERLIKEIEELKSRPTGLWKENQ